MEYVVPLIIVLVVVVAVVVASRFVGRRGRAERQTAAGSAAKPAKQFRGGREVTREDAEAASARLTPELHRAIYSLIAQHQVLNAVKEYRRATRLGLGESAAAVAALAQFPQPSPEPAKAAADAVLTVEDIINAAPEPAAPEPAAPEPAVKEAAATEPAVREAAAPQAQAVPAPAAGKYRYRAIVTRGDEVREVASTRLNEEIFSHIRTLAQAGDHDGAARLLCEHADIGVADALEFVSMIESTP